MEIRVLRYFITIAEEQNITKAAEVLHLTQPTLSRQIAQLEEELGVALLERGCRKIALTEEGRLLYRRAQEIVGLADRTVADLPLQQKEIEGTIVIGGGEIAGMERFLEYCNSFRQLYPKINYQIYTEEANAVKDGIDAGLVDIGLLLEPVDKEKFNYIRLNIKEQYVCLMRPDDPLAAKKHVTREDLVNAPLILPSRRQVQSELENWFGQDLDSLNIVFSGNLTANNALAAMQGYGYALVVDNTPDYMNPARITARPLSPSLSSDVVLAWKKGVPVSRSVRKLIEHIQCLTGMVKATK